MCSEKQSTRECNRCGAEKPLDKDHFYWDKTGERWQTPCKDCRRELALIKRIGIDYGQYHAMLKSQKHTCAICNCHLDSSRNTKFAVDHDHKSGKVRGLLCIQCNTALGLFKDSTERLQSAITYVQRFSCEDIV